MNITIFNGSSNLGFACIKKALSLNFRVKTFIHTGANLPIQDFRLLTIQGNISETHKIEAALIGGQALIYILDWDKMPSDNEVFFFEKGIWHLFEYLSSTMLQKIIFVLPNQQKQWHSKVNTTLNTLMEQIIQKAENTSLNYEIIKNDFVISCFSKKIQYLANQNDLAKTILAKLQ